MTLWAVLCFPVFFFPSAYMLSRSLRYSVLAAALVTFLGPTLRCLPLWFPSLPGFTLLCHIGAFINGVGGPINMAAPIQISAAWFPPHERTRATSIGQMFNALGVGVSYVLGNVVVSRNISDESDTETAEHYIMILLSIYSAVGAAIFIFILIYFPSSPPSPPSISASEERTKFREGWLDVVRNRNCWLLTLTYALSGGLVQMWQSTMVILLTDPHLDLGLSETWCSTLGIAVSFSAVLASIVIATLMDYFRKKMKLALIFLLSFSGVVCVISTLITEKIIIFEDSSMFKLFLYILFILGVSLACAASPIAFEFCVELCFPVSEGILGNWLVLWFNTLAALYFGVSQIPDLGNRWMNFILPGATLASILPVILIKEQYKRSKLDD